MSLHACTIVSENYLPYARVLARSFREHHPESRFFVLLVGRAGDLFDPDSEDFELLEIEDLANVPELRSFVFKYSILECNTAVKPYFLEQLLELEGVDRLCYLDPDIQVYSKFIELEEALDSSPIVVTPHLTAPLADGMFPDELAILRAGAYNLGFIAVSRSATTGAFLRWWKERMFDRCVVDPERGLFVDQKWIDLAPGLFDGTFSLNDPGYNVAYWNLPHRPVSEGDPPRVGDHFLRFFHFSGIQPGALDLVSSHQDRLRLDELGFARDLYEGYSRLLLEAGHDECSHWPYAFGRFSNGVPIPDLARSLYLGLGTGAARFGDPFEADGRADHDRESFFGYLNEARATGGERWVSRLLGELHERETALHRRFPDPDGADREAFLDWVQLHAQDRHGLDGVFLEPAGRRTGAATAAKKRATTWAHHAWRSATSRRLKQAVKRRLGPERTERLKQRLQPAPPAPLAEIEPRMLPRIHSAGVNLIGYFEAESGMGEGARSIHRALESAGIAVSAHGIDLNVLARRGDRSFGSPTSEFPYDVTLLFANADQVEPVRAHVPARAFAGRYNVGFWLWELDRFPETLVHAFSRFHEIWTPSRFCLEALSQVSPVPVRRVPIPVEPRPGSGRTREDFGLDPDRYTFAFVFDFLSYVERKNPRGALRAFRRAFGDDDSVELVLKASHGSFDPKACHDLQTAAGRTGNVRFIAEEWDRGDVDDLLRLCDCYVSLHRSEGFGLTLAESMAHGRPVIATPHSGNADFFHEGTGLPVDYRLVELDEDIGPYPAGSSWAEPDLDSAATRMRQVYENRDRAAEIGRHGAEEIRRQLSTDAVARGIAERYRRILEACPGPRAGGPGPDIRGR